MLHSEVFVAKSTSLSLHLSIYMAALDLHLHGCNFI